MSKEVVVVTTNKDAASQCGIAVIDLDTGTSVTSNFKQCIADVNCICYIGGPSSFSGSSSSSSCCGDYIAVAQSGKPVINVYQWNKPQVHYTCHVQEIMTCLCADACGTYLIGGSHKGWMSIWEVGSGALVASFQAHSRRINRVVVSNCNSYVISCSDEGVVKVYSLLDLLDGGESLHKLKSRSYAGRATAPKHYRSYNAHSLPATGLVVVGAFGTFRVYSCSTDKTVCMYDVHSGRIFHKMTFPHGLESIALSSTCDSLFVGSTSGPIFSVDMGLIAIGLSAQHAQRAHIGSFQSSHSSGSSSDSSSRNLTSLASTTYSGHSRAVSALSVSLDNTLLVSASLDGSLRVWDVLSRQCLKDLAVMNKLPLTSCDVKYRSVPHSLFTHSLFTHSLFTHLHVLQT